MNENQRKIIEKSREFAERVLIDGKIQGSIDEYCIFSIGRFMLTKELVLKKNHETRAITFDYTLNGRMAEEIINISNYVQRYCGKLVTNIRGLDHKFNTIDVKVVPEEKSTPELVKALWIINKIRDSIAHGQYDIDYQTKEIIIKNDKESTEGYALVCNIPISIINKLLIVPEFINIVSEERLEQFSINNIEPKIKLSKKIPRRTNLFVPPPEITVQRKYTISESNKPSNVHELLEEKDNYAKRIQKSIEILSTCFKEMMTSPNIPLETKNELLGNIHVIIGCSENTKEYAEFLDKLVTRIYKNDFKSIKYDEESIMEILEEMSEILKLSNDMDNVSISLIAMHNYLQNLFAFSGLEKTDMRDKLYLVDTGKLNINYIDNQSYKNNIAAIRRRTEIYIERMTHCMSNFSHPGQLNIMKNETVDYYESIIKLLNERNHLILSSVRNGVEHALISETKNGIILADMANQQERKNVKFVCNGSFDSFYDLATSIEVLSSLTPQEVEGQKEKFTSEKIVTTIIQVLGDSNLGLRLNGCLSAFYGLLHANKQSLNVEDLTTAYRTQKAFELKALLLFRQSQLDSQGGGPKL